MLTGYGAKTLPGVREAIEGRRWAEAQDFIGRTAAVVDAARAKVEAATALVKAGLGRLPLAPARGSVASEHGASRAMRDDGETHVAGKPPAPDSPPSHVASLARRSFATPPLASEGRS